MIFINELVLTFFWLIVLFLVMSLLMSPVLWLMSAIYGLVGRKYE